MNKKQLYMIGNSHIDPVWFWNWEEGMQEVKATFASALSRMREYDDYKFTCTSTAFLQWIERLLPDMFEEIRERVREGRWEITGGWFIESDCILPCGEAFVRQGLYGQRYLKEKFGSICRIGSNVDSFGHNANLPQILKKSGMDSYIFMRPRLDTPVFKWESPDGSQVNAICLPAEYTTWFREPTIKNIKETLDRTKGYDKMVCCYGVGNHGGGPTIENIETIRELSKDYEEAKLTFSTFSEFLEDTSEWELPVMQGAFEKINQGCYSVDSEFKRLNRLAERRLVDADLLMSMAAVRTGSWMKETGEIQGLWNILHFNEFHDTMGGTITKGAREEAIMQLSSVCARAGFIKALAIQETADSLETRGDGYPLILFNTDSAGYHDYVEIELEWFCQSPLKLLDKTGKEIPYQRIHTAAKVRHTTLGGRRRIVFWAQIPACGYAIYRVRKEESALCLTPGMEIENTNPYVLENQFIRAEFDSKSGMLYSLTDKKAGYQALKEPASIRVFVDERDAWGSPQDRKYGDLNTEFRLLSIDKVESGGIRETVRVRTAYGDTKLEQLYSLGAEEQELQVENRLRFNHTWTLLKAAFPTGMKHLRTKAEMAYGMIERNHLEDDCEYNMQRFLDVTNDAGSGLAIANDSKYSFNIEEGRTQITIVRSAIYAQGNSPNWQNEVESYEYTDQGMQTFKFVLKPHGEMLPAQELYRLGKKINGAYEYLADSVHAPSNKWTSDCREQIQEPCEAAASSAGVKQENVAVVMVKKAEDDEAFIVRLLELSGRDTKTELFFNGSIYAIEIGHNEILTLKISWDGTRMEEVNLIEKGEHEV